MQVIDRTNRCINLSRQNPDADVLEQLRQALCLNDFFVQLDLSYNEIGDDCLWMLCALLKDKTFVQVLNLRECQLKDKLVRMHLIPALLARQTVTHLNLSNNPEVNDTTAEAIALLLQRDCLVELNLMGTGIHKAGGEKIIAAVRGCTRLKRCVLPFTVGFQILDSLDAFFDGATGRGTTGNCHQKARHLRISRGHQLGVAGSGPRVVSGRAFTRETLRTRGEVDTRLTMTGEPSESLPAKYCQKVLRPNRVFENPAAHTGGPLLGAMDGLSISGLCRSSADPSEVSCAHYRYTGGQISSIVAGASFTPGADGGSSCSVRPLDSAQSPCPPISTKGVNERLGAPFLNTHDVSSHQVVSKCNRLDGEESPHLDRWMDPATSRSFAHLHTLENRSKLVAAFRQVMHDHVCCQRGLKNRVCKRTEMGTSRQ